MKSTDRLHRMGFDNQSVVTCRFTRVSLVLCGDKWRPNEPGDVHIAAIPFEGGRPWTGPLKGDEVYTMPSTVEAFEDLVAKGIDLMFGPAPPTGLLGILFVREDWRNGMGEDASTIWGRFGVAITIQDPPKPRSWSGK